MVEDADAPALLEWISSVDGASKNYTGIEELADGEALLRVMHDLSPDGFPSPDGRWGCSRDSFLLQLLEGLEEHLQGRGESDRTCEHLLEQAKAGYDVDPALLTKLVLVATVENDLPRRRFYVEAMMSLSHKTQATVHAVLQRFQIGAGLESPTTSTPKARPPFQMEPAFTPPTQTASRAVSGCDSVGLSDFREGLPDFREAGLDLDTRFRRLQEQYNAAMDVQERIVEEKTTLKRDLEAEQARRRKAEQAEHMVRLDLREAEEARDRAREEQRAFFEQRLQSEVGDAKLRLRQKDEELEVMREELGLARGQAASAEKLSNQLELFKQKLEESQAFRHENVELRAQIEELINSGENAAVERLHRSLTRARESASKAAMERDEAQRQCELLREELSREKEALRRQGDGGAVQHGSSTVGEAVVSGYPEATANNGRGLALEASAAILAAAAVDNDVQPTSVGPQPTSVGPQSVAMDNSMLERLLAEQDRATRAETTLQLKSEEVAQLVEQKTSLTKQVTLLEAQIDKSRADSVVSHVQPVQPTTTESVDSGKVQELQGKLMLRERELQVHQWRGKAENASLVAQESLMVSCFHELGLRYQRLRVENDRLRQRLQVD